MKRTELPSLAGIIREANEKAKAAADASDDGGTCNFDTCIMQAKLTTAQACDLSARSGVRVERHGPGKWWVWFHQGGQANKRTRAMEAGKKHLQDNGIECYGWYQVD